MWKQLSVMKTVQKREIHIEGASEIFVCVSGESYSAIEMFVCERERECEKNLERAIERHKGKRGLKKSNKERVVRTKTEREM